MAVSQDMAGGSWRQGACMQSLAVGQRPPTHPPTHPHLPLAQRLQPDDYVPAEAGRPRKGVSPFCRSPWSFLRVCLRSDLEERHSAHGEL